MSSAILASEPPKSTPVVQVQSDDRQESCTPYPSLRALRRDREESEVAS